MRRILIICSFFVVFYNCGGGRPAGGGSCTVTNSDGKRICDVYVGAGNRSQDVKSSCNSSVGGGTYSSNWCNLKRSDYVIACDFSPGSMFESIVYYLKPDFDETTAVAACKSGGGTWIEAPP